MRVTSPAPSYISWPLYAFAASAVASIAAENIFIWLAVALFLFFQIRNHQKFDWPMGPFPLATLLFLGSFFAAALWGVDTANSFHTVHKYLTILLIFFVAAMPLAQNNIRNFLLIFTYGAVFCSLAGFYKHFWLHQDRVDSFSGDKMVFGGMLMIALLLNLMFLKQEPKKWIPWIFALLIATCLVFTQTRGAWIGFIVGFAILAWRLDRRWLYIGAFSAIALFFALPHPIQDRIKSIGEIWFVFDSQGKITNASSERFLMWQTGLAILKDHPWGIGQGNISDLYLKYKSGVTYDPTVPHLHNNFMQILVQNGWIGLGAYLFWIFSYYRTAFRFKSGNQEERDCNWTLLCVFSATLVWGLTEYTFSHQYMNLFFALLGLQLNLWKNSAGDSGINKGP